MIALCSRQCLQVPDKIMGNFISSISKSTQPIVSSPNEQQEVSRVSAFQLENSIQYQDAKHLKNLLALPHDPIEQYRTYSSHSLLGLAVSLNDSEKVKLLLAQCQDYAFINHHAAENITALQTAAGKGNKDIVDALIEAGADIDIESGPFALTALHAASKNGHVSIVETLIKHGADVNHCTDFFTCLSSALSNNHRTVFDALLTAGADINAKSTKQLHLLYFACSSSTAENIKAALAAGARLSDFKSADGYTPLLLSVRNPDAKNVIKLLLEHGEPINQRGDLKHCNKNTPIIEAIDCNNTDALLTLLEHGANANDIDNKLENALTHACRIPPRSSLLNHLDITTLYDPIRRVNINVNIVHALLKAGANPNEDNSEFSALSYAVKFNSLDAVKVLLENGANVNIRSRDYSTPIFHAIQSQNTDILHTLINHGADIHDTYQGKTPLLKACYVDAYGCITELLRTTVNVNDSDNLGNTPLIYAVSNASVPIVKALLAKNADISVRNNAGEMAEDLAPLPEIKRLLDYYRTMQSNPTPTPKLAQ